MTPVGVSRNDEVDGGDLPFRILTTNQTKRGASRNVEDVLSMNAGLQQAYNDKLYDMKNKYKQNRDRKSSQEHLKLAFNSGKQKKAIRRQEHCLKCTQCDYWMQKIKIYKRKVDKHVEQVNQSGF